jgi:hypothetical protein
MGRAARAGGLASGRPRGGGGGRGGVAGKRALGGGGGLRVATRGAALLALSHGGPHRCTNHNARGVGAPTRRARMRLRRRAGEAAPPPIARGRASDAPRLCGRAINTDMARAHARASLSGRAPPPRAPRARARGGASCKRWLTTTPATWPHARARARVRLPRDAPTSTARRGCAVWSAAARATQGRVVAGSDGGASGGQTKREQRARPDRLGTATSATRRAVSVRTGAHDARCAPALWGAGARGC